MHIFTFSGTPNCLFCQQTVMMSKYFHLGDKVVYIVTKQLQDVNI